MYDQSIDVGNDVTLLLLELKSKEDQCYDLRVPLQVKIILKSFMMLKYCEKPVLIFTKKHKLIHFLQRLSYLSWFSQFFKLYLCK